MESTPEQIAANQTGADRPLPAGYRIRAAVDQDLDAVHALLFPFIQQRVILRRTRAETTTLLSTGFVAEFDSPEQEQGQGQGQGPRVVGFCAVEIYSKKLAEIQCLVVYPEHQRHGLGRKLVKECIELARNRKVMEVMAISSSEDFLRDLQFDYALPNQKRALFLQLRSREEVYLELEGSDE